LRNNDIDKIQIIHDLKENFSIDSNNLINLVNQINDNKYRNSIERFFRGYKIEDQYLSLCGSLPWVKLIHGLEQKQLPSDSKKNYQVSDYLCIFENAKKADIPILIEVKSVADDKKSLELMKKQADSLECYANKLDCQVIFAIYWVKLGLWTHVPIDVFEKKTKKYKITLENAFKSDISLILGDVSFLITNPIYRKTVYGAYSPNVPKHSKYGCVMNDYLSIDNKNYFEINSLESSIIDAFLKMETIQEIEEEKIVIEASKDKYFVKLSHLIIRHLATANAPLDPESFDISRRLIVELMKKLDVTISYAIPSIAKEQSKIIYNKAFEASHTWDNFVKYHKTLFT
jgi:hypothetical protein